MNRADTGDGNRVPVKWRRTSPEAGATPIVQQRPYIEMKLEHPGLEPNTHGDRFFPDAVPYELDGTARIFYWQPALSPSTDDPSDWEIACATTHALVGIDSVPAVGPPLATESGSTTALVVDGTVGGEATICHARSYSVPEVSISSLSTSNIELVIDHATYSVSNGERRRIRLDDRRVDPVDATGQRTVTPELVVRYPGRRELHHPAVGATYRLFPSFGLDLTTLANPLPVPTVADELDDSALAEAVDVDLTQRPYPERVLWQAFAYTAFDPHADAVPELAQLDTGHIVLRVGNMRQSEQRVG